MLEVQGLTRSFGGVRACDDVSLTFAGGATTAVVGPNGAGKSTLVQLLSGVLRPESGRISLADRDLTRLSPDRRFALGIARTFQTARVFPGLTVWDSVMIGAYHGARYQHRGLGAVGGWSDIASSVFRLPGGRRLHRHAEEICAETLALFGDRLLPRRNQLAYSLSYANRRRLEIARVLASRPRVLLLDEPTAGMNPTETAELAQILAGLRSQHLTMVFVEHKMNVVRDLSDRVVVMDAGRVIADGTPDQALSDPLVIEAYLGTSGKGN
ncbi:ABC transporter ATP-binding protein [Enemella dayhoffiae]|uniref:ABC transporter ATP-binding protein n=1 Tax=Enemella dayhoffiae TaxID=2016507 RepID=A0A255GRD5_9ACTN|nr:ABC transporter ATP-binding protein [Enemella dayhoffiae]OYO18365.1 ABC transporter ATP-binding protein [Enemella dayhoffiae]